MAAVGARETRAIRAASGSEWATGKTPRGTNPRVSEPRVSASGQSGRDTVVLSAPSRSRLVDAMLQYPPDALERNRWIQTQTRI